MPHTSFGTANNDIKDWSTNDSSLAKDNQYWALGGDDTVYGRLGNDLLYGDRVPQASDPINYMGQNPGIPGNDNLYGNEGNYTLYGDEGSDYLDGGSENDELYGGSGNDQLYGRSGNDILDGGDRNKLASSQSGDDTIYGGSGNDTYYIDSIGDSIIEYANEGIDTVQSSISYTLGDNLENLTLRSSFSLYSLNGFGNALNNRIIGNSDGNSLYGYGGNDTIEGGFGNDSLYGGEGHDSLFGGEGNDYLSGGSNNGNDYLDGGAGNDTLEGGYGDDIYFVDSIGDVIIDSPGTGTELVVSSISWTLQAGLDYLTLRGSDAINGVGNNLNNTIRGNDANNNLYGMEGNDRLYGRGGDDRLSGWTGNDTLMGGFGNDTLLGGADADTFVFSSPLEGIDTIRDFAYGEGDKIQVSASGFGIGTGDYSKFSFDSSTGALSFDGTQFASIQLNSGFVPSLNINIV